MLRYMQQVIVPEVGAEGLQMLAKSRVLIIGAGGLGIPLSVYLSGSGVGTIGIVDGDKVAATNLSRQFLYDEQDIGGLKATLLVKKLKAQNPSSRLHAFSEMLDETNARRLFNEYDIICDCTDNAAARILCDRICGELHKPLVYAVVRDWQGYVTVLHHQKGMALENIFTPESLLESETLNCSVAGIINSTCGIAGSIQAAEVIKIILGLPSKLDGGILAFNTMDPVFRVFELK